MSFNSFTPNGISGPCYQCGERHTACHDQCAKYQTYVQQIQAYNKARKQYACTEIFGRRVNCKQKEL